MRTLGTLFFCLKTYLHGIVGLPACLETIVNVPFSSKDFCSYRIAGYQKSLFSGSIVSAKEAGTVSNALNVVWLRIDS